MAEATLDSRDQRLALDSLKCASARSSVERLMPIACSRARSGARSASKFVERRPAPRGALVLMRLTTAGAGSRGAPSPRLKPRSSGKCNAASGSVVVAPVAVVAGSRRGHRRASGKRPAAVKRIVVTHMRPNQSKDESMPARRDEAATGRHNLARTVYRCFRLKSNPVLDGGRSCGFGVALIFDSRPLG